MTLDAGEEVDEVAGGISGIDEYRIAKVDESASEGQMLGFMGQILQQDLRQK